MSTWLWPSPVMTATLRPTSVKDDRGNDCSLAGFGEWRLLAGISAQFVQKCHTLPAHGRATAPPKNTKHWAAFLGPICGPRCGASFHKRQQGWSQNAACKTSLDPGPRKQLRSIFSGSLACLFCCLQPPGGPQAALCRLPIHLWSPPCRCHVKAQPRYD